MAKEIRVTGNSAKELLPQFDELKHKNDSIRTDADVIRYLLKSYAKTNSSFEGVQFSNSQKPIGYDLTEKDLVDFATQDLPLERLIYKGVLAEAKRIYSEANNDNRIRKTRIESLEKIDEAIEKQMKLNQQGDKTTQRYISKAWIQKETRCNFAAIQEYLAIHKDRINAHNVECGIDENHNRHVLRRLKRQAKDMAKEATVNDD